MIEEGVIPIWKPEGFTSHDVVAVARRAFQLKRIGHTGTLDPMVTGVLPLCLGRSTRFVEYIQDLPKQYEAELTLGISTNTEDWTGEIIEQSDDVHVQIDQIERIVSSFVGEIEQMPPMFSAIKQNGVKLYDLARQGIEVERPLRSVTIYKIELLEADLETERPKIRFRVDCSKGTYIRTLCVDIGKKLGYPAMMSKLVRTKSGPFTEENCITIEQLRSIQLEQSIQSYVVDERVALQHLPEINIPEWAAIRLVQGQTIHRTRLSAQVSEQMSNDLCRIYDEHNRFVGLFEIDEQTGNMKAIKVFASPETWNRSL